MLEWTPWEEAPCKGVLRGGIKSTWQRSLLGKPSRSRRWGMKRSAVLWPCKKGSVKTISSRAKCVSAGVDGCYISISYSQLAQPHMKREQNRFYWLGFDLLLIEIRAGLFSGLIDPYTVTAKPHMDNLRVSGIFGRFQTKQRDFMKLLSWE